MLVHHTRLKAEDWPFRWFSPLEYACRGTGMVLIDEASSDALHKLDAMREALGVPIILTSGFRTPEYNATLKGAAKNSLHMRGIAFDCRMDNHDPAQFEAMARSVGFTGFGYYPGQGFMHIDTGPARVWGTPFPARLGRFAPEAPRPTAKDDLVDATPVIAAGGAAEAALREIAPHAAPDWQGWIIGAAAAIALGMALWRIIARMRQPNGQA